MASSAILAVIDEALASAAATRAGVVGLHTLDSKLTEPGIVEAARALGLAPRGHGAGALDAAPGVETRSAA
ncbi:MAG: cobalamin biosynthesis protein, partial [Hyphomicrobiales bacterium]|nr:cobalamin biosynthesis protein [Hyphomicrobiales bacterium]